MQGTSDLSSTSQKSTLGTLGFNLCKIYIDVIPDETSISLLTCLTVLIYTGINKNYKYIDLFKDKYKLFSCMKVTVFGIHIIMIYLPSGKLGNQSQNFLLCLMIFISGDDVGLRSHLTGAKSEACPISKWLPSKKKIETATTSGQDRPKKNTPISLPYIKDLSENIQHLFRTYNIPSYHKPFITIRSPLVKPKDKTPKRVRVALCTTSNAKIVKQITSERQQET